MRPFQVSPVPWRRLPADLAAAMRPRLEATVRSVTRTVTEATPAFAGIEDAKFDRDVRTAVRVAVERFLDLIGTDEPALPPPVREVFVALGAAEAREDRGPEVLLAALRTAARSMLRMACEAVAEVRPVHTAELVDLSDAVSAYADELVAASTDGFARQLREQAGEGDRRRRRLAELLLRGGAPHGVVLAAATGIGWPRLDAVVAVVLPLEHARDARFRFGADGVVVERERDAVLLLPAGPRTTRSRLADALRGRGAVVGPTLPWQQLPEAVRLAELTAELTPPPPGPPPGRSWSRQVRMPDLSPDKSKIVGILEGREGEPVFADDHLATLALHGEPGALVVLSARRLAPLDGLRPARRDRLLATLHAWLRHWGSRAEVAAELFVHPQTVSYRLARLRELLGDDLDDPRARFELLLALAFRTGSAGPGRPGRVGVAVSPRRRNGSRRPVT